MPIGQVNGATSMPSTRSSSSIRSSGSTHLAVHLVDEGDDGRVARAADLEQAQRLRFDAVRGVDHHQRGIDRGQHAVGVFREVRWPGVSSRLMTQSRYSICITELATEMPRCFSISIQSDVAWRAGLARLHAAGDLDRAREQQQLFGQRGLARVRVGNDGKRAPAGDFSFKRHVGEG
jgi:hypothetical protein